MTDALLYQTGRRVSDLVRHVYDRTTVKHARSVVEYGQQLMSIKVLVNDISRSAEERLDDIGKLLEDLSDKPPTSHAASVCETLTDDHHRIRNLLVPLRELELSGREAEPSLQQLELLSSLHDRGVTELPSDCEVPVSASWRRPAGTSTTHKMLIVSRTPLSSGPAMAGSMMWISGSRRSPPGLSRTAATTARSAWARRRSMRGNSCFDICSMPISRYRQADKYIRTFARQTAACQHIC
ncbi:TPA: hypothetical protein QDB06_001420 [Burkholderia vietnamiensis]|nr:hypothetical protein [Burkholderia vietnamiensis]HDR9048143.1 hypothetical protein [Burkholderia vietnamiensis]HDR9180886.1 hypothetical protein [Burkholderia vietnamiensis]HDR9234549.1 hypothetical protein [Burkholderia vietnamiensis]